MNKIAVFYHCLIYRGANGNGTTWEPSLIFEQMCLLAESDLLTEAAEFHVGVNGGAESEPTIRLIMPRKARVTYHSLTPRNELFTIINLQQWLPGHEDWYVCYFHVKGITHQSDAGQQGWRRRMQDRLITNWRQCVADLDAGYESVGCHWLTPEQFPAAVGSPFWGGNFWWAKASFLSCLPPLDANSPDYWLPEKFIGTGRRPKVKDYIPGWP